MPETLVVKWTLGLTTQMSSFAKWKNRFRLLYPAFNHSTAVRPRSHKLQRKIPKWPRSIGPFSPTPPRWVELEPFLEFPWPERRLSRGGVLRSCVFRGAPSVCLGAGVKLKHFVNPLRVEGDVDEERRLRRGAFGALDANAHDDFALVLPANQRTAVVFLGGGGRAERMTPQRRKGSKSGALRAAARTREPLRHTRLPPSCRRRKSCPPPRPL